MTDKRIKMECPFCHRPPEQIQINAIGSFFYRIRCECGCTFIDKGKQEVIDKWNRR